MKRSALAIVVMFAAVMTAPGVQAQSEGNSSSVCVYGGIEFNLGSSFCECPKMLNIRPELVPTRYQLVSRQVTCSTDGQVVAENSDANCFDIRELPLKEAVILFNRFNKSMKWCAVRQSIELD